MSALIRLTRSWLSRPASYAVLAPLVTIAGAATTIAAPILLEPANFSSFILLMSVFQYIADFDLGLARLVDRTFSKPCIDMTGRLRAVGLARALVAATMLAAVLIAAVISCSAPTALAGVAGVAFMLSNGPLAYYRATQDILAFTLAALLMQIGLSLPRLLGLLTGGVTGCMVALAAWYFMTAVVLNIPFAYVPTGRRTAPLWPLFADAFPLCIFSALWLLYLLSNRWVSFTVSSPIDAGLFGFGANLVVIGVGVFGLVAQAYYPRHLAEIDQVSLYRELSHLLVLITGGALVSVLFCRFGLQYIFPHFAGAASSSAVVLISGIPLCLCAWLIPLVIASSERPWREASIMFGVALLALYGLMRLGARYGIVGQAWGCLAPAMTVLGMQLHLVVQNKFLAGVDAICLGTNVVFTSSLVGVVWYVSFVV